MNVLLSHEIPEQGHRLLGLNVSVILEKPQLVDNSTTLWFSDQIWRADFTVCLHRRGEGRAPFSTLQSPGFE